MMNEQDRRRYNMFQRVDRFGGEHEDQLPPGGLGRRAMERVAAAMRELSAHGVSQAEARGLAVESRARTRATLIDQLSLLRRTERVMAAKGLGPDQPFAVPRAGAAATLLEEARASLHAAEPFAADFIAHGLPTTFVADFGAAIAAFEQATQRRAASRSAAAAARLQMRAAVSDGLAAVRELDAIVRNVFRNEPTVVEYWKHQRRVGPARPADTADAPVPVPPAPTAALAPALADDTRAA